MKLGIGAIVEHPTLGEGVIFGQDEDTYRVYFKSEGEKEISKAFDGLTIVEESSEEDNSISLEDVVEAVQNVFDSYYEVTDIVELGDKWDDGKVIIQPGNTDLKGKEIPIDSFFHKIVMVRDRLRVLEQNINSHKKLSDEDKVHLQQYITRIYGSLTTFNVLFRSKNDWFIGDSSKDL